MNVIQQRSRSCGKSSALTLNAIRSGFKIPDVSFEEFIKLNSKYIFIKGTQRYDNLCLRKKVALKRITKKNIDRIDALLYRTISGILKETDEC